MLKTLTPNNGSYCLLHPDPFDSLEKVLVFEKNMQLEDPEKIKPLREVENKQQNQNDGCF